MVVDIDMPIDVTDIEPSPARTSEDEAKEASKSKESVQDKVTTIDETLKDTEDLKSKIIVIKRRRYSCCGIT